jgi:hypothetical protein
MSRMEVLFFFNGPPTSPGGTGRLIEAVGAAS